MVARSQTAAVIDQEYYGLPADFSGMRDIEISNASDGKNRITLIYLTPEQMNQQTNHPAERISQKQVFYTIIANQFQIFPTQKEDRQLEIIYYQNLPPLSDTVLTNWLSDYAPDAYVFGLMVEISAFVKDANTANLWDGRFNLILSDLKKEDKDNRWSGSQLSVRLT